MYSFDLSRYASASVIPSPVNIMMAQMAETFRPGVDINLGAGYVNERTIPREIISEALEKVVANPLKYKHPFNYGGAKGTDNLTQSLKGFYEKYEIGGLTSSHLKQLEVVVGVNGATSLLESISQVLKPGIVIMADPIYYIYGEYLRRVGFEILAIPEDEEGLQASLLREELARLGERKSEISFFYIVTVSNPTTTILSNERRKEIVEIANQLCKNEGRLILLFLIKLMRKLFMIANILNPIQDYCSMSLVISLKLVRFLRF